MASPDDQLRRIDALIQVGLRLATTAPTGRIALAKIAASIEPEWLPQPWGQTIWVELDAARSASLEPLDFGTVEKTLKSAWGAKPSDELDELEREPVAVTPTSQVHRGELDGKQVAIKVLRPGLGKAVRQDLAILEGLLSPLGAAFPALDTRAVLRELRERVVEEFDLESEAAAQRRFHRALRDHPYLSVPAPITRLAHEGVLVSEWASGEPLRSAPDPDRAAARLLVFVLGGLRAGIVHCDPDPDDVIVTADGRLQLLDFGATATVDVARADVALATVEAFAAGDEAALGAALAQLGLLDASHAGTALSLATYALGPLGTGEPARLDVAAVVEARRRVFERPQEIVELLLNGALPAADLWPGRGIALLFGTIARTGATGPWRELVQRALRDGWNAEV
jgi:predicted unusual protein kinase regulating ubiquinone biosynthesis (AarF/ABC1/UbiB family)